MSQRQSIVQALCLLVLVPVITAGCRLPTALSAHATDLEAVVPNLATIAVGGPGLSSSDASADTRVKVRRMSRRELIAEAKQALLAVLSSEQVYFQREVTFTDAADIADIRVKLGADLSEASPRWAFSVSGASLTGFVAKAEGRDDTKAKGLVVTLSYQRGQPLVWKVEKTRRR